MKMIALLLTISLWVLGAALSPFVYWPAYVRLWGRVLGERSPGVGRT